MAKRCRVYKQMPQAQDGYNFAGVTNPAQYLGDLTEAGDTIDKEAYFNAWNASPQGAKMPYSTNMANTPGSSMYSPIQKETVPSTPAGPTINNIKGSYNPQYGKGPNLKKRMVLQDGGATITQDSQKDDVSGQKSNNFMSWLHKSSDGAKVQQEFEQDMQMLDIGFAQYGGDMQSGFQSGNYGQKVPLNMDVYQDAYKDINNPITDITNFSNLAGAFAQYGQEVSYPGYGLQLLPEIDDSLMMLPEEDTETFDKVFGKQPNIEDSYTTYPGAGEDLPNEADYTTGSTPNEKKDKGKFGSIGMDPRNTNKAQAMIAGMNVLTAFGSMDEAAAEKKRLAEKQSDVFQNFATVGSDRGDYLANAPGIGTNFRPDETTRMGYNTKIAQEGIEIDSELELTEEQINELIAQGYNLEYLD